VSEDVEVKMSAETAEMLRAWSQLGRQMDNAAKKAEDFGNRGRKSSEGASGAIVTLLLRYASLTGVLATINKQLEFKAQLEAKSLKAQQDEAGAQRGFLQNLGMVSDPERTRMMARVRGITGQTGAPRASVWQAAGEAVSAKGAATNDQALDAVLAAARLRPDNPAEMTAVAAGLLDVGSLTGSFDAQKNLGFLIGTGAASRNVTMESLSRNIVPGAISVAQQGDDPVEAMALPLALGSAMKDPDGARARTAAVQLAEQLGEFLPKLQDTNARIGALQQDPKAAGRFLAGASFEVQARAFVRDLVSDPASETARLYRRNQTEILQPDAAGPLAGQMVGAMDAVPLQQITNLDRKLKSTLEGALSDNIGAGTKSSLREALGSAAEQMPGSHFLTNFLAQRSFDIESAFANSPQEAFKTRIEGMQQIFKDDASQKLLSEILVVLKQNAGQKIRIVDDGTGQQSVAAPMKALE